MKVKFELDRWEKRIGVSDRTRLRSVRNHRGNKRRALCPTLKHL
jgi:hypothetical protein